MRRALSITTVLALLTALVPLFWEPASAVSSAAGRAARADVTDGLVLHYPLDQASGSVVTDTSGNGRDGALVGGGSWGGAGGLTLDGVDDHVKLPDNVMAGLTSITVSVDVLVDSAQSGNYFIWGLGNPAVGTPASGNGYLFATGNNLRATISDQWWNHEQRIQPTPTRNLARDVWKTVTYTQTGTTGVLYEDGAQVAQNAALSYTPAQIGNGVTTNNVLGESNYAADNSLRGKVRNFRIYDRALTTQEVSSIALTDANRVAGDAAALDLGDLGAVTSRLPLSASGAYGSTIAWASSAPSVIASDGTVTRPAATDEPVEVTLTATVSRGAASQTRTFVATVLPEEDDQAKADAAAAALSLVEPEDVRGNLTVPTAGRHGATVSWTSSAPLIVSPAGVVRRPAHGSGDATVTLTATVAVGSATATREIPLTVRELPETAPYTGYAFSYFTGNTVAGEKIYFAASRGNNALRWDELNGGQPVLESTFGRRGLRDPFLIRSPEGDTFYLIATDLAVGRGDGFDQRTGSRYLEVWESHDLVNWSEQRHVLVSPPTAGNTWAPEAYWDEASQSYVVFWASQLYPESDPGHTTNSYNRMLIATTRDFRTFSTPTVWQDPPGSRIDSTVIREGDTYYRFTKDEGGQGTGCSDIIQEQSTSLTAPTVPGNTSWTVTDSCIGRKAGTSAVEGPTAFAANPGDVSGHDYYLFVDEYGGRGYIPLATDHLAPDPGQTGPNWTVPASYRLPASPRHGTVIPVTQAELDRLRATIPVAPPVQSDEDGLVARYPLATDATDTSGHGYDATVAGGASFADGALALDGTDDHVRLPNNIMAGLQEITVSLDVRIAADQAAPYFVYGLGNTSGSSGNGYLFTTGDAYRTSIAQGDYRTEETATSGSSLARGVWKTLTYTLDAEGAATIYLDGRQVGIKTGVLTDPGDIGNGFTAANYIGRSLYSGDRYLKGSVRDFRLYSRALSGAEVTELAAPATSIASVALPSLKVPAVIDDATSTVTLPVEPGTDLSDLAPMYGVRSGSQVTPAGVRDYREPVTLTVTAPDGATRDWTVRAVEMRSPVLPGFNADPNIAVFDDVFYLYATSDGFPGWGGNTFYVWKSTNLVDWERSAEPILTLDGANGDVPWATGNAWAPTIIERDGRYYFYFSGQNAALNRKTIGVAVADSPEGPFVAEPTAMILNNEAVTSGQAIDPAAFLDPQTGRYYLYWGNGSPTSGPVMAELGDDMTSLKADTIRRVSGLTDFREGSFVNYRDGIYHLTYAIDDTGSPNYRVGYATAPSAEGPWTYRGVVLEKDPAQGILGTGHSSIVQVPGTDDWYIAYHRFAIPGGDGTHRETTIDRVTFGADGLMQEVTPTLTSVDPLIEPETPTAPTATAPPEVRGTAVVGRTLTAGRGTWDRGGLSFGYRWLRDGRPISGATGTSYLLRPVDVGHRLAVEVTATDATNGLSGERRSAATARVAKAASRTSSTMTDPTPRAGRAARLTATVRATPQVPVAGRVAVLVDGRRVATRDVRARRARFSLRFAQPGRHRVVVRYLGSASVATSQATRTVRVTRR